MGVLELRACAGMLEGGEGGPRLKHDVDEDEIDGSPLGRLGDPER